MGWTTLVYIMNTVRSAVKVKLDGKKLLFYNTWNNREKTNFEKLTDLKKLNNSKYNIKMKCMIIWNNTIVQYKRIFLSSKTILNFFRKSSQLYFRCLFSLSTFYTFIRTRPHPVKTFSPFPALNRNLNELWKVKTSSCCSGKNRLCD